MSVPGRGGSVRPTSFRRSLGRTSLAATLLAACGGAEPPSGPSGPTDPGPTGPTLASITVTSTVGPIMAVDRTATMTAMATDSDGNTMSGVSFTWVSSNTETATVNSTGTVTGVAAGATDVSASSGGVSGSVALQLVDADLDGVGVALTDPFAESLRAGLDAATAAALDAIVADCTASVSAGNVSALNDCIGQALATAGVTPDETVLLAVHGLFLQHARNLLALGS